jgi:exopolyphosphatase/guanosine-5'-triphosphate,3'-diphosphate pyrophosphatase
MKAAIDIGTNTVLLLVAKVVKEQNTILPIHEETRTPRLGKGVDADKNINEAATERVLKALKEYRDILRTNFPLVDEVIVTATSAVRDAQNREAFMSRIKEETGFNLRLLSGKEEAECTATGALSVLKISSKKDTFILDIGGGSTEVAVVKQGKLHDAHSYNMGCVRFTERFLHENPPTKNEIEPCRAEIKRLFDARLFETGDQKQAIGVAGTITTLAGMALELNSYKPEKLNGFKLTLANIQQFIEEFCTHTYQQMLERNSTYLKGREDIFLAGLLILETFLKQFGFTEILVSTGGIRHGALLVL